MYSALLLVKAAISRSGGFSRLIASDVVEPDKRDFMLKDSLEFTGVKFKRSIARGRPTGEIDISAVFDRFLREAGLSPRTMHYVDYNGQRYLTFSNSDGTVMFDCEFDPRVHGAWTPDAKVGFAGNCNFWIATDAPKYVTRTLRSALARFTVNVANARGTTNPNAKYQWRTRTLGIDLPVKDPNARKPEPEQELPKSEFTDPISEESMRLFEKIAKGQNLRVRIH
jgi:hypothetical protein